MVNAGAIATTSLVPGATHAAKWKFIHDGLSEFAGRTLPMNEEVLQSALAKDLAVMGATLADGGVNPLTRQRVVEPVICHYALAVMATAGLYETSGDWLYDIGLPGKSGIGGGIVTVSPGKGGLGTFAPRLDAAGTSVKGQLASKYLSQQLGMDLFVSQPDQ